MEQRSVTGDEAAALPALDGVPRTIGYLASKFREDDISGLAAELSFRLFVVLLPLLVVAASIGSVIANMVGAENPAEAVVDSLGSMVSDEDTRAVERQVESLLRDSGAGTLLIAFLAATWAGVMAMGSTMKALNRVYGLNEDRSTPRRLLIQIGLTLLSGALIVAALVLTVGLQVFDVGGSAVTTLLGLGGGFAVVVLTAAFLYRACPAGERDFAWVSLGGIAFAVVWVLGSAGFAIYLQQFGSYNATYGVLGAVLVLLIWLYITSAAFLLGAELDMAIRKHAKEHLH